MAKQKIGVLIVNLGTPEAPTAKAVRRFLREFLSDRRVVRLPRVLWQLILNLLVLPFRSSKVARNYQKIWTDAGSPLRVHGEVIVRELQQYFRREQKFNILVKHAMRYGSPNIGAQLRELRDLDVAKIIILPLYPQFTESTTSSVFDAVTAELSQWKDLPSIEFKSNYFDHPTYIDAVVQRVKQHWQQNGQAEKLIFSFHGLPKKVAHPYLEQCQYTTEKVVQKLGLTSEQWQLVFQSRFGAEEWLQPYCDVSLRELAQSGCQSVDVICPGFAVDCLETLEEINMTNRKLFLENGGKRFQYVPALNASVGQVKLLADLIVGNAEPSCQEHKASRWQVTTLV